MKFLLSVATNSGKPLKRLGSFHFPGLDVHTRLRMCPEVILPEDQNCTAHMFLLSSAQVSYHVFHSFWYVNNRSVPQVSWRNNIASIQRDNNSKGDLNVCKRTYACSLLLKAPITIVNLTPAWPQLLGPAPFHTCAAGSG